MDHSDTLPAFELARPLLLAQIDSTRSSCPGLLASISACRGRLLESTYFSENAASFISSKASSSLRFASSRTCSALPVSKIPTYRHHSASARTSSHFLALGIIGYVKVKIQVVLIDVANDIIGNSERVREVSSLINHDTATYR